MSTTVKVQTSNSDGLTIADLREFLARYDAETIGYIGDDARRSVNVQVMTTTAGRLVVETGRAMKITAEVPVRGAGGAGGGG